MSTDHGPSLIDARRLRWMNWCLRWKRGAYTLWRVRPSRDQRQIRRDVVIRCLQNRQFRLGLTVLVMPYGYCISKDKAK